MKKEMQLFNKASMQSMYFCSNIQINDLNNRNTDIKRFELSKS